jgi:NADPH2 dehydrogenase
MSTLFSSLQLRDLQVPNRIVVSPMCQYVAVDGKAGSWHVMHYGGLALSGAGTLFIESTAVEPDGRITPGDLGLWDDATYSALAQVVDGVRTHTPARVILQLSHAGRKASSEVPWRNGQLLTPEAGGWRPYGPSATPHHPDEAAPVALNTAGLSRVRNAYVAAARRAVRLGVDGIELHGGHGYLLHQFLSPIANERTDAYGGSLENRMRFPLEIIEAVRGVLPSGMPLGIKLSASDWMDAGWDLSQSVEFARQAKLRGIDWVTASSGGISLSQKIQVAPNYQVPFSKRIREEAGVITIAVGLITTPTQAEDIVASGSADLVAIARGMLFNPRWGWHAAAELGGTIDSVPPSYWRAAPQGNSGIFAGATTGSR